MLPALLALLALLAVYAAVCLGFSLSHPGHDGEAVEPTGSAFPAGFLWGTATAAYQVEGGNTGSDWAQFEEEPGRIARGERCGRAVDHWNRVAEDVALMKTLGANAYRFSIEWARLEPEEGRWDEPAWSHYLDEARQLREAGIVPMVTLLHFTLPLWLARRGGVLAKDFPERFGRFAGEAARRLHGLVDLWCTLNEPNAQVYLGYVEGIWPPGHKAPDESVRALAAMLRGHAAAAEALRMHDAGNRIGVAMNLIAFDPASRWWLADWIIARIAARAYNWTLPDAMATGRIRYRVPGFPSLDEAVPGLVGSADFLGVNYYTRLLVRFAPRSARGVTLKTRPGERSDMDLEIHPPGLFAVLRAAWRRYRLPIYVTENGLADAAGTRRSRFIRGHAGAIARALGDGIPVRGYFHWSLLDNFEWTFGFAPRFGLYRVDDATLARSRAPGAETFAAMANEIRGGFPPRAGGGKTPRPGAR